MVEVGRFDLKGAVQKIIRQVLAESRDMKIDHIIEDLEYIAGCLRVYKEIMETGENCNTCGKQKTCEYVPGWGQQIRYNCPLWKDPDEEEQHEP